MYMSYMEDVVKIPRRGERGKGGEGGGHRVSRPVLTSHVHRVSVA